MTGAKYQELDQVRDSAEYHLIDLVPRDCCHTAKVDLETKLQLLEQSLGRWLREKTDEIESEQFARSAPVPIGQQEVIMSQDNRDILEVLQAELDFIEKGGYGRSVRTPWQAKSPFQDSLTCINYAYPEKVHPCNECHLIDFVPGDRRSEEIPCHFIPLNESGETLVQLEGDDDQKKLEEALKGWLRARIKEIVAARKPTQKPSQVS